MKFKSASSITIRKHRPTKLIKFSLIFIGGLLAGQVIVSNRLATAGDQLAKTEAEISNLQERNIQLRNQIASSSAILTLRQKAQELGFTQKAAPVYFSPELPVALELHP